MDKNTKYDRQIRLWAQDGQSRLEKSHICLVNATSTGAELLKNLVLPGIGSFTIVDSRNVEENDLSGNFFLQEADLGKSIAQSMTQCLLELNPDVKGTAFAENLSELLLEPDFWLGFNAVVVSEYVEAPLLHSLKQILWDKGIPLLIVSTSGFYGSLHIINKETTIVETHDPSKMFDLRIDQPWHELQDYADSFVLETLDDPEHAHVPYIVIFIKALQAWKSDHGGQPPLNYAQKKQFRSEYVEGMARDIRIETNFMEASQSIHRALQVSNIPDSIRQLFENPAIADKNLSLSTPLFWLYVRALKEFVATNGNQLPLPGTLPDMASKTSNYVNLQKIFKEKALRDQHNFKLALSNVYQKAGRSDIDLNDQTITTFCKNAAFLFVCHGSPLSYSESMKKELLNSQTSSDNSSHTLAIYFGLLALHHWRDAGEIGGLEGFFASFRSMLSVQNEMVPENVANVLKEIYSHQTSSYHNLSSYMGGITAQEILKISTEQYIPLDNLYVFDGIKSVSNKWKA